MGSCMVKSECRVGTMANLNVDQLLQVELAHIDRLVLHPLDQQVDFFAIFLERLDVVVVLVLQLLQFPNY